MDHGVGAADNSTAGAEKLVLEPNIGICPRAQGRGVERGVFGASEVLAAGWGQA